jgi:hypothetical protein
MWVSDSERRLDLRTNVVSAQVRDQRIKTILDKIGGVMTDLGLRPITALDALTSKNRLTSWRFSFTIRSTLERR